MDKFFKKKPFYDIEINRDIFLTEKNVELTLYGKLFKTNAHIYCKLLPSSRIAIKFEISSSDIGLKLFTDTDPMSENIDLLIDEI